MTDSWGFRFAKGAAIEGVTGMAVSAIRLNLAIGTGGMSELHIQIVTRAYAAYEGYANGGVLGSAVDAYNVGNPLYGMGVAGARLYHAIDSGNVEEIGAATLPVAMAVVGVVAGKAMGGPTSPARAYSVAFETQIPKAAVGSRGAHFKAANESLLAEMNASSWLASVIEGLEIRVPVSNSGAALPRSPQNWTWHHVPDKPGVMQLVPTAQHQGKPWQPLLHPAGIGGFKLWGAEF